MAEISNKVNIGAVYIFLFLNTFTRVRSDEHIPVLIWTSSDFRSRQDVDLFAFNKVKSDRFQFYMLSLLGDEKPTIVIFLEQVLRTDDFDGRDENGNNSFPFLTELTAKSKLDYFREVEAPHEILAELSKKGYAWKHLRSGEEVVAREGDLLLMEFRKIDEGRPETLKSHDETMEEISRQLMASGKSWICVYTARHSDPKGSIPDKKLSSWHDEEQFRKKPTKAVSVYHDEHTGFALVTRGSIELHLRMLGNTTFKRLDNYLRASATAFQTKINFVIWFSNYKLTFYLNRENHEWIIHEAKIANDNGDTPNLIRQQEQTPNKCYTHTAEFKSEEGPLVAVKLPKYKFLKLPKEESCVKPYGVELMAMFIFCLVVFAVLFWDSVLDNYDFSPQSQISPDKILAFKFTAQ